MPTNQRVLQEVQSGNMTEKQLLVFATVKLIRLRMVLLIMEMEHYAELRFLDA
jgi:hypothetical protein